MKKKIKSALEAKELTTEEWTILAHGLRDKKQLPSETYNKIKNLFAKCPLCDWFQFDTGATYTNNKGKIKHIIGVDCNKCPLGMAGHKCEDDDPLFSCYMCDVNDTDICEHCFDSRDYFLQWENAFDIFEGKEALEASMHAAQGILTIVEDWEV